VSQITSSASPASRSAAANVSIGTGAKRVGRPVAEAIASTASSKRRSCGPVSS